jgi:hypothetical protein
MHMQLYTDIFPVLDVIPIRGLDVKFVPFMTRVMPRHLMALD